MRVLLCRMLVLGTSTPVVLAILLSLHEPHLDLATLLACSCLSLWRGSAGPWLRCCAAASCVRACLGWHHRTWLQPQQQVMRLDV